MHSCAYRLRVNSHGRLQNNSYVADGKYMSHWFSTELQWATRMNCKMQSVSAFAVGWHRYHPQKNFIQQSVSTYTGRKRNVALRERSVAVTCGQLQLGGHCQYWHLIVVVVVCRYLEAPVDCRLPSTWA